MALSVQHADRLAAALRLDEVPAGDGHLVGLVEQAIAERDALRAMVAGSWVRLPHVWRKVPVGALIVDKRARLWEVLTRERDAFRLVVTVRQVGHEVEYERRPHLDDKVDVLTPVPVRDGLVLIRGLLGGNMLEPEDAPDAG